MHNLLQQLPSWTEDTKELLLMYSQQIVQTSFVHHVLEVKSLSLGKCDLMGFGLGWKAIRDPSAKEYDQQRDHHEVAS